MTVGAELAGAAGDTRDPAYCTRLEDLAERRWKVLLDVQRPYRRNVARVVEGPVLDVGCGIGRHLRHLGDDAVGVDHNAASVDRARADGLQAWTPEEFHSRGLGAAFGSLLFAHVLEHLDKPSGWALLCEYLPYLAPGGRLVLICPQQAGFASDETHVTYLRAEDLVDLCRRAGLLVEEVSSFPFPSAVGRLFRHNETVVCARSPR